MALKPSSWARARGQQNDRSAYHGASSDDDYLSDDDELTENDLKMLHTDYSLERDLTYFPPQRLSHHLRPSTLQTLGSDENLANFSEKYGQNPDSVNADGIPPRDASLTHRESIPHSHNSDHYLPSYRIPPRQSHAYQYPSTRRRPLVEFIKNEWQQAALSSSTTPTRYESSDTSIWIQIWFAPRFQRGVLGILVLLFLVLGIWKAWVGPKMRESYGLRQSTVERMKHAEGWFGENLRPEFVDMIQLDTLDESLVPGAPETDPERRVIFIGDVHGCNDELNAVLSAAKYRPRTDHLIFTGDMISKGPNSPAVIDLLISHNASCVRGNHEDRVLLTYRDLSIHPRSKKKNVPKTPPAGVPQEASTPEMSDSYQKLLDNPSLDKEVEEFSRLDIADRALARQLTKRHIDYLSACPTILDIGPVAGLGNVHVVHAGLIPHVGLERQDPMSVMHMRTVDLDTHVPSSNSKGTPWYKLWNQYQSMLPKGKRGTIVYGHDSRRGLQLKEYSKGLDTGCVWGGKLTAYIVDAETGKVKKGTDEVVSVPCKDYRNLEKELVNSADRAS